MDQAARITALVETIRARDSVLGEELQAKREDPAIRRFRLPGRVIPEAVPEGQPGGAPPMLAEAIVLRTGRPVLAVSNDEPQLTFSDAESEVWRSRLITARSALLPAIRAVGRIELENNPWYQWIGTGWLVRPDIIVTNRHVAEVFGKLSGESFVFRQGAGNQPMGASVDFLEEFGRPDSRSFRVTKILGIEDDDGPDLAFLQVEGEDLAPQIALCPFEARMNQLVAVIGYPARDSRIPDQQLMEQIFGDVFDKKRLAPGQITFSTNGDLEHDCSTLGGNSGSVVLDLETGQALGIHFAGKFLEANFAVPATILNERLESITNGGKGKQPEPNPTPEPSSASSAQHQGPEPQSAAAEPCKPSGSTTAVTWTIPLKVTVELGIPQGGPSDGTIQAGAVSASVGTPSDGAPDAPVAEGVPEDYVDRQGYEEDFLGPQNLVALPGIVRDADQIVEFEFDGQRETVLRYEHFSVVMNRKRRMCFFSAVNIDGALSRGSARTSWRYDPRIDQSLQIMYECYGNPPKFSRGHMTRREDPVWGTPAQAALGNSDSMHVTNVTPQMQTFNAPVWLGLEDYALQNARHDQMNISVFTGPILLDDDPVRYSVQIPRSFWKVIAFIHDETGELTATGYTASQNQFLPEFVFGDYDTWQRPLTWVEENAGVTFGGLTQHDPLGRGVEALDAPLTDFGQIRFRA